ncbi:helix-hairpin-helix domain-containing protein [candidate division FCPU426 bacterium]|nr:helix-hairpin-helix domain-containing protein [candidate division FCPU426 bacterium]
MRLRPTAVRCLALLFGLVLAWGVLRLSGKLAPATSIPAPSHRLTDINRASLPVLASLPGIGPVLAERIIGWREKNGDFQKMDDLLQVKGIGRKKLERIRHYFIIANIADRE